jgi:hypothetical protein
MKLSPAQIEELRSLLARSADVPMTEREAARLNELLAADVQAQQMFVDYAMLDACLDMVWTSGEGKEAGDLAVAESAPASEDAPVIIQTFPVLHAPAFPSCSPLGSFLLSYGVAAAVVAVGMLMGWICQVSLPQSDRTEVAGGTPRSPATPLQPEPKPVFVGRITGMVDCQWVDPRNAPVGFDRVAPGRKYALVSGLLEIVYDSGARVILQGPCDYEVESGTGGYLSLGRLTAKVEKRGEGREERGEGMRTPLATRYLATSNPSPLSPLLSPLSSLPSSLFFVRTPTATVADLGTEFGVEVDKSGGSKAHVYRGKVEVRVDAGNGAKVKTLPLGENQSARVEAGKGRVARIVREPGQPSSFVREMPRRVPIQLFNTGVNVEPGDPDPHWQIAARSDDTKFQPRAAAVVAMTNSYWVVNQRDRSQWISIRGGDLTYEPDGVGYTFRTTFDLNGMRAATAILHVRFAVDNRIRAMRLNGQSVRVPPHGHQDFGFLQAFSVRQGFVEGVNVLEIDVENADPAAKSPASFMGLLVELDGSAMTAWPEPPTGGNAREKQSKK